MLAEERRSKIQEILVQKSTVTIPELVDRFGTSEMTIRRDLDELEARGVCQRIHGGAMSLRMIDRNVPYPPFSLRERAQVYEKIAIARAASSLINPGDLIAIDSGTTAAYLGHALRCCNPITVLTNSLRVMAQLYDVTSMALISPGGTLSVEGMSAGGGDLGFMGPVAVANLRNFRPNKAFIGTSGFSVDDGVFNYGIFQAEIKRTLIEISEQVILLADYSKFGQAAGMFVTKMDRFDIVITDINAPEADIKKLRTRGVEVIQVEPAHELIDLRPVLISPMGPLFNPDLQPSNQEDRNIQSSQS